MEEEKGETKINGRESEPLICGDGGLVMGRGKSVFEVR